MIEQECFLMVYELPRNLSGLTHGQSLKEKQRDNHEYRTLPLAGVAVCSARFWQENAMRPGVVWCLVGDIHCGLQRLAPHWNLLVVASELFVGLYLPEQLGSDSVSLAIGSEV
jgi:hypothetical protein